MTEITAAEEDEECDLAEFDMRCLLSISDFSSSDFCFALIT